MTKFNDNNQTRIEKLKEILISLGEKDPTDEVVRQSAHNLIGLFSLLEKAEAKHKPVSLAPMVEERN